MSHFERIISFKANPHDVENYQTMMKWNNESQQLRVDRNQKLYTMTQPSGGFLKVIYAVLNFFIKWFFEGWHADATLENRIAIPRESALICGWRGEMAAIAERIFNCCGVPCNPNDEDRKDFQRLELQNIRKEAQELMVRIEPFRGAVDRMGNHFVEIYADLEKLSAIPGRIEALGNFPNQIRRDIRQIFEETFP